MEKASGKRNTRHHATPSQRWQASFKPREGYTRLHHSGKSTHYKRRTPPGSFELTITCKPSTSWTCPPQQLWQIQQTAARPEPASVRCCPVSAHRENFGYIEKLENDQTAFGGNWIELNWIWFTVHGSFVPQEISCLHWDISVLSEWSRRVQSHCGE